MLHLSKNNNSNSLTESSVRIAGHSIFFMLLQERKLYILSARPCIPVSGYVLYKTLSEWRFVSAFCQHYNSIMMDKGEIVKMPCLKSVALRSVLPYGDSAKNYSGGYFDLKGGLYIEAIP